MDCKVNQKKGSAASKDDRTFVEEMIFNNLNAFYKPSIMPNENGFKSFSYELLNIFVKLWFT